MARMIDKESGDARCRTPGPPTGKRAQRSLEGRAVLRMPDLVALVGLALLPSLLAAWLIPLAGGTRDESCAPDEAAHMTYVAALADGQLATWPMVRSRMAMFPPSQYALQLAGVAAARAGADAPWHYRVPFENAVFHGFPLARVGSALLGSAAVACLALAVACLTGSRRAGWIAGLAAALYPQRFFIASYVNNDISTFAGGALLVWALARWASAGEGDHGLVSIGIACGIVLLGKVSGYALLPPTALWVAWAGAHGRARRRTVILACLAATVVAGPMLVWNALRNGGDPLGVAVHLRFVASPEWQEARSRSLSLAPDTLLVLVRNLARSSFMNFANLTLHLPIPAYLPWLALVLVGSGVAAARMLGAASTVRRGALWLAGTAALSFGAIVYQSFWIDFSPQGRYVLLPVILVTLVGLAAPEQAGLPRARLWTHACLGYLALVAVWSLWLLVQWPCGRGIAVPGA